MFNLRPLLASATALVTLLAFSGSAHANDWYVSIHGAKSGPTTKVSNDGTNGAGNPSSDIDRGFKYGIAVGKEILPALKLELEYSMASYDTDPVRTSGTGTRALDTFGITSEMDVDLLTLAASYEFRNTSSFTPFVKGGMGSTFFDMDADLYVSSFGGSDFGGALPTTFSYEGSGSEFAYYLGAGVGYTVSDNIDVTLEYRYSDLGEVATDFDDNGDRMQTNMKANNVQLGLRYNFR